MGNRSALEWVIDQYRVKTDKRSGITSDPNRPDDPEYIVRLVEPRRPVGQASRLSASLIRLAYPPRLSASLIPRLDSGKRDACPTLPG